MPPKASTVMAAMDMCEALKELYERTNGALNMRIGIHSGAVVAGVIGIRKFTYDLWGDTVNGRHLAISVAVGSVVGASALLAAQAAVAPAAEGRGDRELLVGVDPDRAGLHRAAQAPGALEVAAPDAGGQPVHRLVGEGDGLGSEVALQAAEPHRLLGLRDAASRYGVIHQRRGVRDGEQDATRRHAGSPSIGR